MLDQFSFSSAVLMRFDYPLNYILLRFTGSIVN